MTHVIHFVRTADVRYKAWAIFDDHVTPSLLILLRMRFAYFLTLVGLSPTAYPFSKTGSRFLLRIKTHIHSLVTCTFRQYANDNLPGFFYRKILTIIFPSSNGRPSRANLLRQLDKVSFFPTTCLRSVCCGVNLAVRSYR